jgi:hypothetical protein
MEYQKKKKKELIEVAGTPAFSFLGYSSSFISFLLIVSIVFHSVFIICIYPIGSNLLVIYTVIYFSCTELHFTFFVG